ncbi:DNA alkylation repair protein [Microbacterium sp. BK668]|uniref:DNA alkylation repair protein n=1 Tax=Microbacterium sp. BK668 TaxID=2512118 RepID=UPI00105C2BB1|nr:DNA alkylation repair protein [Microbacterium sp. BK668]TDN92909.1 3-methyladenine DNA glycosylase AlkD [Microbacterium sp. BK668]
MTTALAQAIRAALRAAADPERARAQQAYMKSAMPFHGVALPEVRRLTSAAAKGTTDAAYLLAAADELWDGASHREERYAAMALIALNPLRADPAVLPRVEHMVRTGRWWDITDDVAHRMAEALDARPRDTADLVRRWAVDEDLWIRRVAIISQLDRRDRLDETLLADAIEPNTADGEFFIRKAIGWALRQHARVAPDWVRRFVAGHDLSPLTVREALKHIGPAQPGPPPSAARN